MSESRSFSHLVVVGSSAGGIEALGKLLSSLPQGFSAPVVIAQHLDPGRESHLQEILSRRSALPVRTVSEHEPLESGVVFVVPANRHVDITDSAMELEVDSSGRPKPSVDRLLNSAAGAFGERLIAVVLSGTGSDGTDGARQVSEAGGTVVIQDPMTAAFGGMPGSLAPNTVDIVAPLERIGPLLGELVAGAEVSEGKPEERRELQRFLEGLRERHGIDFRSYKMSTIMRRLKRRMAATGAGTIAEYSRYMEENPDEYKQVINTFLIKVTEFFRDRELFEYLKAEVLPELIEDARKSGRQLRIWSAGCATGEEAYSLAILLSDVLGNEDFGHLDARIFATDIDEEAVNFARHGVYPASALANLSAEQVERYFIEEDGRYQVRKPVRGRIVFGEHDLAQRSPFPRIDLVLSRNVLIYFTPELQRRVLQLFAYSLRDGGYLVLGKAETATALSDYFGPAHRQHTVYRRRGERFLMPPSVLPVTSALSQRARTPRGVPHAALPELRRDPQWRARIAAEEDILNRLPVGVVLVDRGYHIRAINPTARRLLSIHGVAVGEDLLHLLRNVPYAPVRRTLDAAFGGEEDADTGPFAVEDVATGDASHLQLVCQPMQPDGETGQVQTVTVVVNDLTEAARTRQELEQRLHASQNELEQFKNDAEAELQRRTGQNERLVEENRMLDNANRELNNQNQELRSNNEEAMISAEEAQAAAEEVETLNEELQATNEELETLNEELQATIEELNTTNDDLQARSAELQEMARSREEERRRADAARRRLETILDGIGDAVLAVGADGAVLFSNDVFSATFGDGDPGEPDADSRLGARIPLDEGGARIPRGETPQARASRGETFEMRVAVEDDGGTRRVFETRGGPFGNHEGGGVVVIRKVKG